MPTWLTKPLCFLLGHQFGAPRPNGSVICARCGALAYAVPASWRG